MLIAFSHAHAPCLEVGHMCRAQRSIHDEQTRRDGCGGSMGFCMVSHLVTHAGLEDKFSAIFQFCMQLTFEAKQDVPLAAPMVRQVACRVFDHANPDVAKMLCAPVSNASCSRVLGSIDAGPIGGTKRNARHIHDISLGFECSISVGHLLRCFRHGPRRCPVLTKITQPSLLKGLCRLM